MYVYCIYIHVNVFVQGPHDVGGRLDSGIHMSVLIPPPEDTLTTSTTTLNLGRSDHPTSIWEKQIHALLVLLATYKPAALMTTDELRRGVECLEPKSYDTWGYVLIHVPRLCCVVLCCVVLALTNCTYRCMQLVCDA